MYISRLALDHYRSWNHCVLDLTPGINILQGANGLGKTNIVEAIEVLSTGLSHRTSSSVPLVQRGEHAATIRANIESVTDPEPADDGVNTSADAVDISDMKPVRQTQTTTLEATIAARGANRARINGGQSRYLREILGTLPTVSFTPEDQQLVAGDPAVRRSFINQVASLLIPGYANRLQSFTHVAKQRAALLKQLGQWQRAGSPIDAALSGLEIWTGQFIEAGVALSRDRQRIIAELNKSFGPLYARLAGVAGDLPSNAEIQDAAQDGGEQAAVEKLLGSDETKSGKFEPPLINVGVGDDDIVNVAGGEVQGVVVVLVSALLQSAVDEDLFAVDLQAVAAAGDRVGRAEKCELHIRCLLIKQSDCDTAYLSILYIGCGDNSSNNL